MRATHLGILLGVLLASAGMLMITAPTARAAPTRSYVLYGSAASPNGWGLTSTSLSEPGPTLTVNVGDIVSLKLLSSDGATHNWFIDYNNNSAADSGEPVSSQFSSSTVPVWFNFTVAAGHVGTSTYRCGIHPTLMSGLIVILPAASVVLYGSASAGWGFGAGNLTNPGPTLTVTQGQTVTFELVSQDGLGHTFFVDLNGNGAPDSGEPQSPVFGGSGHPSVISWSWTVSVAAGSYSYECGIHLAAMKGTVNVLSTSAPPAPPDYTIYAALVVVIVIVAIVVVLVIRRRPRSPPAQPPQ